jgi:ABC-type cobalamin transport system permease subunit
MRSAGDLLAKSAKIDQGRFRKLQAARLPCLVSLALFVSGEMWLAQMHFFLTDGQRFAALWEMRTPGRAFCIISQPQVFRLAVWS